MLKTITESDIIEERFQKKKIEIQSYRKFMGQQLKILRDIDSGL